MKSSMLKNAFFNVAYKILNVLFSVISVPYVSRILGPEYLGKVTYAQNILSYFMIIATLGISTYGIREIAKVSTDKSMLNIRFSELFIISSVSTLISTLFYSLYIYIFQVENCNLFLAVGITLYMNIFNIDWLYAGMEEYVYISTRSLIIKFLSIVLLFAFVKDREDYIIYALITSFATSGNYLFNVLRIKAKVKFQLTNLKIRKHLRPITIMFVTILATDLYNQIDVTMIGYWYSSQEIGYYSNAVKLIRIIYVMTTAINSTAIPRMSYFYANQNKIGFAQIFNIIFKLLILLTVPIFIGIFLLREKIVIVLFGSEFLPSAPVVAILSSLIIIISVSHLIGSVVLTVTNNERYLMRATLTGVIVNIIGNALLIPPYGIYGASVASVIAECAVLFVHYVYSKKYYRLLISVQFTISIVAANILMTVVLQLMSKINISDIFGLILSIFCGAFAYLFMLFILKNELLIEFKKYIKRK